MNLVTIISHDLGSNLAGDEAHADKLADLQARLLAWMRATEDPLLQGPIPSAAFRHRLDSLLHAGGGEVASG